MNIPFIFLVTVVVIFILFNMFRSPFTASTLNKDTFAKQLYNGKQWNKYRLGDVVLMDPVTSEHYTEDFYDSVLYHETEYPGTIAYEYMIGNKKLRKKQNVALLKSIIKSRSRPTPKYLTDDVLYLHIRVGDVICNYNAGAPSFYSKVGDKSWWNDVIKYIEKNNITKVVIIAGTHYEECLEESAEYIIDRTIFLTSYSLQVFHRLGKSPDDDLLFVSGAKHFISTGGGYGKLLDLVTKIK